MLPQNDLEHLQQKGYTFEETSDGGMLCIVIKGFRLPAGYDPPVTDLLLRLPVGYPDAAPDMFWCNPPVRLGANGSFPQAADLMEQYLGGTWQRFSRHLAPGVWRPGTDCLESYLSLIRRDLERTALGSP